LTETFPRLPNWKRFQNLGNFVGTWSEDQHYRTLADPDAAYLLAEDATQGIVGFSILLGLQSEHKSLELRRIVVGAPNQGLGRQLLEAVAKNAFDEYGAHRLWLDVFEINARARHVYEAFGFRRDGIFREAVYRNGSYHSLVLMSLLDREYRQSRDGSRTDPAAS
jgi:RimJ/RimL family protein N-acetyltransferase